MNHHATPTIARIRIRIAIVTILLLIGYIFCLWLLTCTVPPVITVSRFTGTEYTPAYHGADLLEISPDGSMTAFKWDKKKWTYKVMWKRKGGRV